MMSRWKARNRPKKLKKGNKELMREVIIIKMYVIDFEQGCAPESGKSAQFKVR